MSQSVPRGAPRGAGPEPNSTPHSNTNPRFVQRRRQLLRRLEVLAEMRARIDEEIDGLFPAPICGRSQNTDTDTDPGETVPDVEAAMKRITAVIKTAQLIESYEKSARNELKDCDADIGEDGASDAEQWRETIARRLGVLGHQRHADGALAGDAAGRSETSGG